MGKVDFTRIGKGVWNVIQSLGCPMTVFLIVLLVGTIDALVRWLLQVMQWHQTS